MKPSVLIVDDERVFCTLARTSLLTEGFEVRTAGTLSKGRAELERMVPDVLVVDRRLPDGDGIELLREVSDDAGGPIVLIVTAYGDVANAVDALQAGAADYLVKPIQIADLALKIRKAIEVRGLHDRLSLASRAAAGVEIESRDPAMRAVVEVLRRVSTSPFTPVLLCGPSGVGKQCAAEALHAMTHPEPGRGVPFVDVNCAALPTQLVESELFGHERGAFTDAKSSRRGLVEMANGGTLFLDEIAELPEPSQAKLLKFLDTMRFRRLGGQRELSVSLRIVAATNQDIDALVREGRLREDLYHRLSVFLIRLPPLVTRREDIPDLADTFVRQCSAKIKKRISGLTPAALQKLRAYDFPGNVRELRNIIERAVILARTERVEPEDIVRSPRAERDAAAGAFFSVRLGPSAVPPAVEQVERQYVLRVLEHMNGRRMAAAQLLGLSYPTFLKRLRELGIDSTG